MLFFLISISVFIPADFQDIYTAISEISSGDTIVISDGYYTGDGFNSLTPQGKEFLLIGSENVVIDLDGNQFMHIFGMSYSNLILSDFILENGHSNYGGGAIWIQRDSNPQIYNLKIKNCSVSGVYGNAFGGGMYISTNSCPIIENCVFENCYSSHSGGGVYLASGASPLIENCVFKNCESVKLGGGLSIFFHCPKVKQSNWNDTRPTIKNCSFFDNIASWGFDISVENSYPTFEGNLYSDIYFSTGCPQEGDCNEDGFVTATDSQIAFKIALGYPCSYEEYCAADVKINYVNDGIVTMQDVKKIFNMAISNY